MIQIVLLLIGITIGSSYPCGLEPDVFNFHATAVGVPALVLLYALVGVGIGRTYVRRFLMARDDPNALFVSLLRCMTLYRVLLLATFAFQVYTLRWSSFVAYDLRLGDVPVAGKLVELLPLPAALLLSWIPLYRLDRLLKGSDWSLRAYLVFQARLVIGPVLGIVVLLFLVDDGVHAFRSVERVLARYPALEVLLVLGMLALLFLLSPVMLRVVWGGRPLEAGPLRERLLALCQRAGLGVRDLLVWETFGGRFTNALVTGVLPWLRYVFFTRPLLDGLTPEELEAVLAHELGHARHRHLLWYFGFAVGLVLLVAGLDGMVGLAAGAAANGVLSFGLVAVYWGFLFLFASRRFEGQADLFSLRLLGTTVPLASALLKVSALNGLPPDARSVTHGSIRDRVLFLASAQGDPQVVARFERSVVPVRGTIQGLLCAGVLAMTASLFVGRNVGEPNRAFARAQGLFMDAMDAKDAKRYDVAVRLLHETCVLVPENPVPWIEVGNCEELRGEFVASRDGFSKAMALYCKLPGQDPRFRSELRDQICIMSDKIRQQR